MTLALRPLAATVGAEVRELDLRRALESDVVEALKDALAEHGVLVFRDQELSAEEQVRFSQRFGELAGGYLSNISEKRSGGREGETVGKAVLYVGNLTVDGEQGIIPAGELQFHADGLYTERPARATMLYAIEVPAEGGDTLFASTGYAYASLPPRTRDRIRELRILLNFDYTTTVRTAARPVDAPHFVHPLVIAHPRSGQPLLNCNRLMADTVVGLPKAESDALIRELCDHLERPEYVYAHRWRVGDLVFWDNLATVHARTDFDPSARRWLRRTTIKGDPLAAAVGSAR